ncbi:MAG TPA: hypothetical protein VF699_02195 [Caulobacteraceae bacterium]|jgi:hypothetical protein
MSTNEAGLSGGQDQGDGGRTTASDTPGGEQNAGVGRDGQAVGQVSREDLDRTDGGHLGAGGDPVEGKTNDQATGSGPADGQR